MVSKQTKVSVCILAAFLQGLCLVTMPAASAIFKSPLFNQLTDHQYGMVFLPQVLAAISFTLLMPLLFNRLGRGLIFYWGLISNLLYLSCVLWTLNAHGDSHQSFKVLLLANFCLGMGFGCLVSVLNVAIVDLYPTHEHAAIAGIHGAIGVGAGLAPLLFNHFHSQSIWYRSPQITFLLLFGVVTFCLIRKVVTANNELGMKVDVNHEAVRMFAIPPPQVMLFLFALVIYGAIEAILGNWTTSLIHGYKGLSIKTASWALSCFWLFLTVGRFLVVAFSNRMDLRIVYRLIPFVIAIALFWIVMLKSETAVLPAFILVGLGCAAYFPLSLSLAIHQNPKWKEIISTVGLAALMLGVGCGSFLTGLFQSLGWIHLERGFMIAVFGSVVLIFINFIVTRRT